MDELEKNRKNMLYLKCYFFPDEPTYIKQLKELRWGHFKHIQQEVKRLEDLERFLDNCGNSDSSTI